FASFRPTLSTAPTPKSVGGMIQDLQEDIKCSICLESFSNPVSIDCGHNFCQDCLFVHLNNSPQSEYSCPECRRQKGNVNVFGVFFRSFAGTLLVWSDHSKLQWH
uniref:RING-type domain-containing protein n=1 Tax=Naja naja TaxID=35670 RepID=A0A8C6VHB5_NAJNA